MIENGNMAINEMLKEEVKAVEQIETKEQVNVLTKEGVKQDLIRGIYIRSRKEGKKKEENIDND